MNNINYVAYVEQNYPDATEQQKLEVAKWIEPEVTTLDRLKVICKIVFDYGG